MTGINHWNRNLIRSFREHSRLAFWGLIVAISVISSSRSVFASFEQYRDLSEAERRQKVHDLYQKQIPLLEQYVTKYPNGDRAADSMFRLGEAYFESAKYYSIQNQNSHVSIFVQRATKVLEQLRKAHPYYDRMDEALLVLASSYLENGETDKAAPVLSEIATRFPDSPIISQASYLLGDYYYNENQMPQAQKYYLKATEDEKSKTYAYYKLAWVAIKQGRPALALKHFEKVLEITRAAGGKNTSFDYSKDSSKEMVWPALEVYSSSKVIGYLTKVLVEQDLIEGSLTFLARGLMDKGHYKMGSAVYDHLFKTYPASPRANDWIAGQLEAQEKMGRSDRIAELVAKVSGVQGGGSAELQSRLVSSAKKYHALAQAEKDPLRKDTLYDQSIAYYQAFDQLGEDSPKAREMKFYEGEALYARGRYAEAREAYRYSSQVKHDKSADAAWNWYLTAERMAPGFKYSGDQTGTLSSDDQEFLRAVKVVTEQPEIDITRKRKASYQSARLVYQLNDYDAALPIFRTLAERYPGTEEGRLSAQLVLDIYNLKKDYSAVANYARKYQDTSDSSTKGELGNIEQKAAFKVIQEEEVQAKAEPEATRPAALARVASKYMQFARQYPQSTLVDGSIWAAIQLQATVASKTADRDFEELQASFSLLNTSYPRSKYIDDSVKLMAEFLAYQQVDESTLRKFSRYRDSWLTLMRQEPKAKRGRMGWLVYQLSSDSQKKELHTEFKALPETPENKKLIAHAQYPEIEAEKSQFEAITLDRIKTLQASTKKKLAALDKFEARVTKFVELGEPRLAVASLNLLAEAFVHMGESLRKAPVPTTLQAEDRLRYESAVAQQASIYENKGRETRALAEKTARELGLSG